MVEEIRRILQQDVGISNEDFQTFMSFPNADRFVRVTPELKKYKIIAEVIDSKYCVAKLKPGQKYTISGLPAVLLVQESDCPLCIKAIGPIANQISEFWERIAEGGDPSQGMEKIVECMDVGIDRGGLGHVVFRVYAQKVG
jgi:uncharacterized repeat protein (TIGR04076 family)